MLIDITQEVMSCRVWEGDPVPQKEVILRITKGDVCNLTAFSMCAHNGTHVDAPFHFLAEGETVEQTGLAPYYGPCFVVRHDGNVSSADAENMLSKAAVHHAEQRILIAGNAVVTADAARVFAQAGVLLIGNESQTVGPENAPAEVHRILLGAGTVLLEGIVLTEVPEGRYILSAAPLKLGGFDGAPCRAFLIAED